MQLQTAGLQTLHTYPPIDETAASIDDVKEAVAKLRVWKDTGICNISFEAIQSKFFSQCSTPYVGYIISSNAIYTTHRLIYDRLIASQHKMVYIKTTRLHLCFFSRV